MKYLFLGLSITSAWGNGHATTYRSLVRELEKRGHTVTFLERDVSWYRDNRDMPSPPYGTTILYASLEELRTRHLSAIRDADAVIVGSYVPDGIEVSKLVLSHARGVTAFYDIDTPITLAGLADGGITYLDRALVPRFDLYLSFTGGPTLDRLEQSFGARRARPLYCSVDPELYYPEPQELTWALGYLGTYSDDRQPTVDELLVQPAQQLPNHKFVVAGAQYPEQLTWPENVDRLVHVPPSSHRAFYNSQRFTLNVTRREMIRAGYSPSVRLFEAAACGTPIISDEWPGLHSVFHEGEILLARSARDVVSYLHEIGPAEHAQIARAARERVLSEHTAAHRAYELDMHIQEVRGGQRPRAEPRVLRTAEGVEA